MTQPEQLAGDDPNRAWKMTLGRLEQAGQEMLVARVEQLNFLLGMLAKESPYRAFGTGTVRAESFYDLRHPPRPGLYQRAGRP